MPGPARGAPSLLPAGRDVELAPGGRTVLDKIFWAMPRWTKSDLLTYYASVSDAGCRI